MSLADDLFTKAFNVPRDPRSPEYKAGALYILRLKTGGERQRCPYEAGSSQADAWHAGTDEGHRIWRGHQITINPQLAIPKKGTNPCK
jgi:hypothetical protein